MVRPAILLAVLALFGCAPEARSIRLADVNLRDMGTIQKIRAQLGAEDGAIFAKYVVAHSVSSASFCGRPLIAANGNPPETVGEAIELTLVRDAEDRAALLAARRPKNSWELKQERWDNLVAERDLLIDAQSMLRERHGLKAESLAEWKTMETRKGKLERRLRELKPALFNS